MIMNNLLFSAVALSDAIVNTLTSALGSWYIILFNAFGIIAMLVKVCEFQLKTRNKIIIFATIASCSWFIYFILQGDFASAFSNLILIIQGIIFYQRGKHKWASSIIWLFVFIGAQAVFGILTFKTALDLFPIFGGAFLTVAYFVMQEKRYRLIVIFGMSLWLLNSITKGYLLATINDASCVISAIIGLVRFTLIEKKQNEQKQLQNENE